MKILFQLPLNMDPGNPFFAPFFNLIQQRFHKLSRPDSEIIMNPCCGLTDFEEYTKLGKRFLNDADVLKSILDGMKEDTDGIIISCFFDPALWPARQMLDVPVTGLAESSFHLASLIGRKFAVITGDQSYIAPMEEILKAYDMRGMAIEYNPVRSINMTEVDSLNCLAEGNFAPLTARVKEVGQSCISDGADVLIIGCGVLSVIVTEGAGLNDIDGVPIVDPDVASVKVIEMLVDLAKKGIPIKSRQGLFWDGQPADSNVYIA